MIHIVVDGQGLGSFSRDGNIEKYGDEERGHVITGREMTAAVNLEQQFEATVARL